MIHEFLEVVTVDDLVRAGACRNGVKSARDEYAPKATAVNVDAISVRRLGSEERTWLREASGRAGYGSGSGYGDGYGDGYG